MTALLTTDEATTLAEAEQVIERGIQTFTEVGNALLKIRDGRLYRADFGTFEDYCRERWGFSRQRAQQLTSAAQAVTTIVDTGLPAPANEGQARELAKVPEPERAEVWRETVERTNGKPTAAAIRQTYRRDPDPEPEPEPDGPDHDDKRPDPEPGIWYGGPTPGPPAVEPNPIAAAVKEARTAPSHIAGKAVDEIKLVGDIIARAGGVDAILADLDDNTLDDTIAELWLSLIDPVTDQLDQWRSGLRRRRLRSVQ